MKRSSWAVSAVLMFGLAGAAVAGDHKGKVEWKEPEAGLKEAKIKGLPTMMVFSAEW